MGDWATTTSYSDLLVRFLKGNTTTSDAVGVSILSRHIDRAENRIKAVLAPIYNLTPYSATASNVPPELRRLSEDLAAYWAIRSTNYQDGKQKNTYLEEFKTVLEDLKEYVDRALVLTYTDGSMVPTRTGTAFQSSSEGYTPIFGLDDPKCWARDPDEIDDTADSREG